MIVAAALLVLAGLGLFVAGLLTEVTAFYWACVAACVVAAVVLYLARRRMATPVPAPTAAVPAGAAAVPTPGGGAVGRHAGAAGASAASTSASTATPAPAEQVAPAAAAVAESSAVVSGPPAAVPDAAPAVPAPAVAATPDPSAGAATARAGSSGAGRSSSPADHRDAGEPPVEEVEVTDLLLVVDLKDEVLVVDEHPRYHVEGCRHLSGQETIPIPLDEARTDGFTPCGACRPDATLADRVRSRG